MKVLTVDDSTPNFSVTPTFGTTEVQVVPSTSSDGSITPLSNVVVVDPNASGLGADGAFSGAQAFATLQAAYDQFGPSASIVIWLCPGSVGDLAVAPGTGQKLCIRGFGSKESAASFIGNITVANTTSLFELQNVVVTGTIQDEGGESSFGGLTTLRAVEAQGIINLPGSEIEAFDDCGLSGAVLSCQDVEFRDLRNGPPSIVTQNALISWDDSSEKTYFAGLGASTIAAGTTLDRLDDAASSGVVGPDSAFNIQEDAGRVVCQPGQLTAARIWTLVRSTTAAAGVVVDVWGQTADLTIQYADATLITVPGGSLPTRLFFFAPDTSPDTGAFVLINRQPLL
jgi:hypothetical protein